MCVCVCEGGGRGSCNAVTLGRVHREGSWGALMFCGFEKVCVPVVLQLCVGEGWLG